MMTQKTFRKPPLGGWGVSGLKTNPNGSGPASPVEITNRSLSGPVASGLPDKTTQGLVQVPITNGAGTFVWEVFGEDPDGIDHAYFAIAYAYMADQEINLPADGVETFVTGGLAPFSTVETASDSAPQPRFQLLNRKRSIWLVKK